MELETIEILFSEGRSTRIEIGAGCLLGGTEQTPQLPSWSELPSRLLVVCDARTERHAQQICSRLALLGREVFCEVLPAGEETKSVEVLQRMWGQMARLGLDRASAVIAVGGGVVGDLAGFAAAAFMRGIDWYGVPTTLVAQVDSSLGGKCGINLPEGKNLVGAFWQPRGVWIDPQLLGTLPEREYLSGFAEVVKYAVIADPELFEQLQAQTALLRSREPDELHKVISRCCRIKSRIVREDERETRGLRAILNYGHTFGHAIERVAGYGQFLHGEAIAIGMSWAARAACLLGWLEPQVERQQTELLSQLGLPAEWKQAPAVRILEAMKLDKKRQGGLPRLVLPKRIGLVESHDWPGDNLVLESITGPQ